MRRLILRSFQSPGDILMLTAAVRDLHLAAPGRFQTDVRTSTPALWENNPHLTSLNENEAGVETLEMHYPLIHQSNQRPYHFIHGYPQYLEERLGLRIPVTRFRGDLHFTEAEKELPPPGFDQGVPARFWIVVAGGKYDFTAKWWDPAGYQEVVDHFQGRITFVQCGEQGHWHPRLKNAVDLVGKTSTREFVRLMYHAEGVLCPVTFAMHLAAAVPMKGGRSKVRPCVVVAGGREPTHWEAYPHHQYLSTVGALPCCAEGGCWKSRCQLVGDGDDKDRNNLCEKPVQIAADLRIPQCMAMISPADVIRRIELYLEGGSMVKDGNGFIGKLKSNEATEVKPAVLPKPRIAAPSPAKNPTKVLIRFNHGLGDAVQLGIVLRHLQKHRPDWQIDVHCLRGKHTAVRGLCHAIYHDHEPRPNEQAYDKHYDLGWYECYSVFADSPCTKACNCLREVFGIVPEIDLCGYVVHPEPEDFSITARYLEGIGCTKIEEGRFNALVIHYEGNTSTPKKNLSHHTIAALCANVRATGLVPVILDWDRRSPLPDQKQIFCPRVGTADIWGESGTGDAGRITALIAQATLFVGIDSGPGKCAGATETPTLIVWTKHHPIQFHDLCPNTTHLVPEDHLTLPPAHAKPAAEFFARHYRFRTYAKERLSEVLCEQVQTQLGMPLEKAAGLVKFAGFWCHADRVEQDWTVIEDVFVQDCYKTALLEDVASYRVAVDVGAHIGTFTRLWSQRVPGAKIIALECAPENLEPLRRNVGDVATVLHAACVGERTGPLELLNSFTAPSLARSTGGSIVVATGERGGDATDPQYRREELTCERLTLAQVMERFALDHIDLLKLDCEGSEYDILDGAPLQAVRFIVGEYHGHDRWEKFRAQHFADWDYGHMSRHGDFGNFHLRNPGFRPLVKAVAEKAATPPENSTLPGLATRNGHPSLSPLARLALKRRWRRGRGIDLADVVPPNGQLPDVILDPAANEVLACWQQLAEGGSLVFSVREAAEAAASTLHRSTLLYHRGGIWEAVKEDGHE